MIALTGAVRIYLALGVTDLRKGINGLSVLTESVLQQDPSSGHLFAFCNRSKRTIKILFYESGGFWLVQKRLSRGTYSWPQPEGEKHMTLSQAELWALLGGLDFSQATHRKWYRPGEKNGEKIRRNTEHLEQKLRLTVSESRGKTRPERRQHPRRCNGSTAGDRSPPSGE
ncbi:MAG: hypothetical protein DRI90_28590 [Deltaproteobacteria bacterium]|nr:MAG: hypothetical protein DRI90_28590 [Deltaproteobacteria bacterium]